MKPGNCEQAPRDPSQWDGLDTYPVAQVEAFVEQIDELESENKDLRARVAELEGRCRRLEELGAELRECAGYLGRTSSDDSDCITRAERACEAWDKEANG